MCETCAGFCISIRFQRQKAACKGGMKNWAPLFQVNEISDCTRQLNLARQTGNSHQIGKGPYHHRLHLRKYAKQSQGTEHFIRCYGCSHRDCMWYPDCVITLLWRTLTVAGGDGDIWGLRSYLLKTDKHTWARMHPSAMGNISSVPGHPWAATSSWSRSCHPDPALCFLSWICSAKCTWR